MNCICGCGRRLSRGEADLNLRAGEVAIELVVWDKARALRSPVAAAEVEAILAAGAPRYQGLLAAIHSGGGAGEGELEASAEWLERSRAARQRLGDRLPVVPKKKIKLSAADQEQVDRLHPERTFSGADVATAATAAAPAAHPAAAEPSSGDRYLEALLVTALEDVRAGRAEEAERALRRFLSERG